MCYALHLFLNSNVFFFEISMISKVTKKIMSFNQVPSPNNTNYIFPPYLATRIILTLLLFLFYSDTLTRACSCYYIVLPIFDSYFPGIVVPPNPLLAIATTTAVRHLLEYTAHVSIYLVELWCVFCWLMSLQHSYNNCLLLRLLFYFRTSVSSTIRYFIVCIFNPNAHLMYYIVWKLSSFSCCLYRLYTI